MTLLVVLGGFAVGRRATRSGDEPALHVLAPASQASPGIDPRENSAAARSSSETAQQGAIVEAPLPAPAFAVEAMPVESLPRAVAPVRAAPQLPRPGEPAASPVRPLAPVAAQAETRAPVVAAPAQGVAADKDTAAPDVTTARTRATRSTEPTARTERAGATESQAAPPAEEPAGDPLVRAVRADIEEEEARRK
jgi:hypothetical protein